MTKRKQLDFRRIAKYIDREASTWAMDYEFPVCTGNLDFHETDLLLNVLNEPVNLDIRDGTDRVLIWKGKPNAEFTIAYDDLAEGGVVFIFLGDKNTEAVMKEVEEWRSMHKQNPEVHIIIEDRVWFWKKPAYISTWSNDDEEIEAWQEEANDENHLTQEILRNYADPGSVFIETGTYHGQGVQAALNYNEFDYIFSIELDKGLAERAEKLFDNAPVTIVHDDSPSGLTEILKNYDADTKFFIWLDAHASGPLPGGASGGCPILDELKAIRDSGIPGKNFTILIDDCRLFGSGEWDYVKHEDAITLLEEIDPDFITAYEDGEIQQDIMVNYNAD